MKILIVGDVVGIPGIKALKEGLPKIQKLENIDFTVVNGENAAKGMGFTRSNYKDFDELDIDAITMGNHTWAKMEIFKVIGNKKMLRPANLPKGVPGKGYRVYEKNGIKIGVMNLLGRAGMSIQSENPFLVAENAVETLKGNTDIIITDFHGEATAEKITFAKYFDGKINIVVGTHTHVQTADNEIFEKGTGYITDLGMTGTNSGIIGMKKEVGFKRALTTLPEKYQEELDGDIFVRGCIFEVDKVPNRYGTLKYQVISTKRINYNVTKDEYLV